MSGYCGGNGLSELVAALKGDKPASLSSTGPVHFIDALHDRISTLEAEVKRLTEENAVLRAQLENADELRTEALDMAEESASEALGARSRASAAEREVRMARHAREAETLDRQIAQAIRGVR